MENDFIRHPVFYERKAVLDNWKDPIKPMVNKYWTNISVEFETAYIIRVKTQIIQWTPLNMTRSGPAKIVIISGFFITVSY